MIGFLGVINGLHVRHVLSYSTGFLLESSFNVFLWGNKAKIARAWVLEGGYPERSNVAVFLLYKSGIFVQLKKSWNLLHIIFSSF